MRLRERISISAKAGVALVEAMEAGAPGYDEYRIGSLMKRVTEIEESLSPKAAASTTKIPLSSAKPRA